MCVLPANIWNQKFFLFFYFWLLLLLVGGALQILYRLLTLVRPLRNIQIVWSHQSDFWTDYSDWLFYKMVMENCNVVLCGHIKKKVNAWVEKCKEMKKKSAEMENLSNGKRKMEETIQMLERKQEKSEDDKKELQILTTEIQKLNEELPKINEKLKELNAELGPPIRK